jgi:DNA polymerase II large subunit
MAKDYEVLGKSELESTLHRLKAELEDLEETTSFYFTHSAAHINGGEVLRDEETLAELKSDIVEIERLKERSEA